jgi:galactose mutarotase-like enzyme
MNPEPELITLKCEFAEATIAPQRGAIVTSFRVRNRELLYLDQATFNDRSKNVRGGIPLLFPAPGKLENDRWRCAGRSGEMKQHGFARNLAWAIEASTPHDRSRVTLSIGSSAETLLSYPWKFRAQVTYVLEPGMLDIRFVITNEDSTPMPFALGLHPYFLVTDKSQARIPTRATSAFDNVAKVVVPFHRFDFTQGETDSHLLDHGSPDAKLAIGADVISIQCSPEFTRWVVWTLPGKEFVCLEPWSAPGNALNTGEGVITLAPGERRKLSVRISA